MKKKAFFHLKTSNNIKHVKCAVKYCQDDEDKDSSIDVKPCAKCLSEEQHTGE